MPLPAWSVEEYQSRIGQIIGVSKWYEIDQDRINRFGEVTEDLQFIHVDEARARDTEFGGTIAHGFLSLSLISAMAFSAAPPLEGQRAAINYGFDRVRFVSPVRAGRRIRGLFTLAEMAARGAKRWQLTFAIEVEIEGEAKPALTCVWVMLSTL
jgi:acyl dehydratase